MGIQAIGSRATVDLTTLAQSQSTSASASASKASPPAGAKVGGAPPSGGGAKPAVSSTSASTSTSTSATKIYEEQDENQDGVVSFQEELLYALKHPTEETESTPAVSNGQLQSGLSAYQQGQQSNSTSSSILFAA